MKILKLLLFVTLFLNAGFESALKNQQDKYLDPKEAFQVHAEESGDVIETEITLAEDIHVADESLKYKIIKPQVFELNVKRPTPHEVNGEMVHEKEIVVDIPFSLIISKITGPFTLEIEFQGCSDKGICYNTITKQYDFETPGLSFFEKIMNLSGEANAGNIVDVLKAESSFFIISLFFIFGLLLALTPCIFPMIPILSSIIVSQSGSGESSAARGFFISLIYVLSMAITYTAVGVVSGLIGADIQSAMQNPWVLSTFALLFLALSFSLFGYYELQLPAKWQSKLHSASDNARGKGILGTAIMGFLSAFIIGPCVAPPLAGAVLFISQTGDALLGGLALFVMSMGMGVPLLLVGIGAGKFMPKPGGWMTKVSHTFGVVMLALAIFMLSKVLPEGVTVLLWAMLFIGVALFMGVFNGEKGKGAGIIFQLLGYLFLIYGTAIFIGFLSGSTSMLHPFEKFTNPNVVAATPSVSAAAIEHSEPKSKHFGYSVERLIKEVEASDKPVVVDFTKKSCPSCRELEAITFPHPDVVKELERFTFITVDVTNQTDDDKALLKHFSLFGTPNLLFFDSNNTYQSKKTLTGFIQPEVFVEQLQSVQ